MFNKGRVHNISERKAFFDSERKFTYIIKIVLFTLLGYNFYVVSLICFFKVIHPPVSSVMLQEKIESIIAGENNEQMYHRWSDYDEISENAKLSVIAAEDQRFPLHFGLDVEAITTALEEYRKNGRLRGASTITQQTVKNLFLWQDRSYLRKALEAYLTLWVEVLWTKEEILEYYLNFAPFGKRIFGIEAAAGIFFKKSALRLNVPESALLAAVLPNPARFSVRAPSAYIINRQQWIITQMVNLGGIRYLDEL